MVHDKKVKTSLEVTSMNSKKLTIKIKNQHNDDDGYEPDYLETPSSADIEVVHKKSLPSSMHGILKQRSMSESSDDFLSNSFSSMSTSSASPRYHSDDSCDHPLRKKVSFNEHVDHTTYKPAQAVKTMKTALKSKRRHARKREEKLSEKRNKGNRRRNNSGSSSGDEQFSSDDCGHRNIKSKNKDIKEEDSEELTNTDSSSGDAVYENDVSEEFEDVTIIQDKNEEADVEIQADKICDNAEAVAKAVKETKNKTVEEIKSKMANMHLDEANSDDSDDDCNFERTSHSIQKGNVVSLSCENTSDNRTSDLSVEKSIDVQLADIPSETSNMEYDERTNNGDSGLKNVLTTSTSDANIAGDGKLVNSCDNKVDQLESAGEIHQKQDGCVKEMGDGEKIGGTDEHKVDTILSWEDGESPFTDVLKTSCPFQFSNDVMFDLDID